MKILLISSAVVFALIGIWLISVAVRLWWKGE